MDIYSKLSRGALFLPPSEKDFPPNFGQNTGQVKDCLHTFAMEPKVLQCNQFSTLYYYCSNVSCLTREYGSINNVFIIFSNK